MANGDGYDPAEKVEILFSFAVPEILHAAVIGDQRIGEVGAYRGEEELTIFTNDFVSSHIRPLELSRPQLHGRVLIVLLSGRTTPVGGRGRTATRAELPRSCPGRDRRQDPHRTPAPPALRSFRVECKNSFSRRTGRCSRAFLRLRDLWHR